MEKYLSRLETMPRAAVGRGVSTGGFLLSGVSSTRWKNAGPLEGAIAGATAAVAFTAVDRVILAVSHSTYDDLAIFARMTGWSGPTSSAMLLWGAVLHLAFAAALGAGFVVLTPRKAAPFLGPMYGLLLTLAGVAEQRLGFAAPLLSYDMVTVGRVFGVRILWGFVWGTLLFLGTFRRNAAPRSRS